MHYKQQSKVCFANQVYAFILASWLVRLFFLGATIPLFLTFHWPTVQAQSNGWYRGPNELVQHSAFKGSSHRRKGAARHKIDTVWLYPLSCPSEEERVYYFFKWFLPAFAAPKGGGGESAPFVIQAYGLAKTFDLFWNCWTCVPWTFQIGFTV